jgi:thiamine kinase-like enzyme
MEVQPYRSRSRSRSRHGSRHGSRSSSRRPSLNKSHSSGSLNKLTGLTEVLSGLSLEGEIPTINAVLDNSLPQDFFEQDIISLIKKLFIKKWWKKSININRMLVQPISGALTNSIYKVTYPQLPSLLLRIYGKNVDNIIDRQSELSTLIKLSSKNIGPKLLGIFSNGRFEQFLEGYEPLDKCTIRDEVISQIIARRMKDLHYKIDCEDKQQVDKIEQPHKNEENVDALKPDENGKQPLEIHKQATDIDEKLNENHQKYNVIETGAKSDISSPNKSADTNASTLTGSKSVSSAGYSTADLSSFPLGTFSDPKIELPMSWKLINKWWSMIKSDYLPVYKQLNYNLKDIFKMDIDEFENKINLYFNWLFLKYEPDKSNLKFCHNDTQYGNLLMHRDFVPSDIVIHDTLIKATSAQQDHNLVVIDFEYSGPNYPAFDIVNHFSEWMSDYYHPTAPYYIFVEDYPEQLQILNFLKSYVEYEFKFPSSKLKVEQPNSLTPSSLIQYEIRKLYNECIYWRPTVQIYWFLWGLIQAGLPKSLTDSPKLSVQNTGINGEEYMVTVNNLDQDHTDDVEDMAYSIDDFEYLKYADQKMKLILGDLIQHNIIDRNKIDEKFLDEIEFLDVTQLDLN